MSERSEQRRGEEEWRNAPADSPPPRSRPKALIIAIIVVALLALAWWVLKRGF
ncbi:MAG TPA: hypothetical protein VIV54_03285 [Burkholderiales bacterium]